MLAGEVAGGIWTSSLALLSDAAHVFMDLFALVLSWGALRLARRPADDRRTFGWHRAEVFAALINGVSLLAVAAWVLVEAVRRFGDPPAVKGGGLLVIAAVGLVANGVIAVLLRPHAPEDLNIRAAFLHVVGDGLASLAVIAGALVVILTKWYRIDAVLAAAIAGMLLWGAGRLVRDAAHILLEGTPPGVKTNDVAAALRDLPGVNAVHDLHVWALCSHITNLSAHLVVAEGAQDVVRTAAEDVLRRRFGIQHTTLQMEVEPCGEDVYCEKLNHAARFTENQN